MAKWSDMTKEERSAEMKRRQATAKRNREKSGKSDDYVCATCGEKFATKYKLANHVRYKHPKRKSRKGGVSVDGSAQEGTYENHISYLFGRIERDIEHYSHSNSIPFATLAEGVAGLLRHPKGR